MNKLRSRGALSKQKNKSFYRVTEIGWKWFWLEICSTDYFKNPMISKAFKKGLLQIPEQPSKIEQAYHLIHSGLSQLTQQLGVIS